MSVGGAVAMSRATSDALIAQRWREGLTTTQIGLRLGLSQESVKRRISRLRRAGIDVPRREGNHGMIGQGEKEKR